MSVPTQGATFALGEQAAFVGKGAYSAPASFYKYRTNRLQVGPQNMEEDLPFQIGGSIVTPGVIRNGSFVAGQANMFLTLEDTIGHILKGVMGSVTTTIGAKWDETTNAPEAPATTTGVNTHVFTFDSAGEFIQPYFAVRHSIPGNAAGDTYGFEGYDCKLGSLALSIPAASLLTADLSLVGRVPTFPAAATAEAWTYANANFDDMLTASHGGEGKFAIGGTEYPITNLSVQMINNMTSPQQEMVVGEYHPDDFVILNRAVRISFMYKWQNDDLARLISTGQTTGTDWTLNPFTQATAGTTPAVEGVFQSTGTIGATGVKHELRFQSNNASFRMSGPPQLDPQNIVMVPFEGTVIEPTDGSDFIRFILVNGTASY